MIPSLNEFRDYCLEHCAGIGVDRWFIQSIFHLQDEAMIDVLREKLWKPFLKEWEEDERDHAILASMEQCSDER